MEKEIIIRVIGNALAKASQGLLGVIDPNEDGENFEVIFRKEIQTGENSWKGFIFRTGLWFSEKKEDLPSEGLPIFSEEETRIVSEQTEGTVIMTKDGRLFGKIRMNFLDGTSDEMILPFTNRIRDRQDFEDLFLS